MYFNTHFISGTLRRLIPALFAISLLMFIGVNFTPANAAEPEIAQNEGDVDSGAAYSQGYIVSSHGQLSVSYGNVVDQSGATFQIQGVSTHNLAWYPAYVNADTFKRLRDELNINTIRLAMYTAGDGGYCVSDETVRASLLSQVMSGIEAAISLDMYVIVDWHILSDGNPNTYTVDAISFFEQISSTYGSTPNIIYEICNEPNGDTSWDDVRQYAIEVIDCIRYYAPDSLIIVGTPNWSQDIDTASFSPIDRNNLLYSLHFYAATQKDELRSKLETAILYYGLPVIVSEFGISESSGGGSIDTASGDLWISMLDYYDIGYVYWNLSNKDEAGSLFLPSCTDTVNWTDSDYSPAGIWYKGIQQGTSTLSASYTPAILSDSGTQPTTVVSASDDYWSFSNNCTVSVTCDAVWSDDSWQYAQYDIIIYNNGPSDISNWRLRISWCNEIFPKEYWSCEVGGSEGSSRLFVPVEYNTTIPAGSFADFGMIVYGSQAPELASISFE